MGRQLRIGNPPIDVNLRRTQRARRLSLRVSRLDGKVSLTVPQNGSEREVMKFLSEREDWLRKHLSDVRPKVRPQIGGTVLIGGQPVPIVASEVKRAAFKSGVVHVPYDSAVVHTRIKAMLKLKARDVLAEASDHYASEIGKSYQKLSLRDPRSRWGSCSSAGVLMYSWRLIMAPIDVLNYVAAHEVAHLAEMNHSAAFWNIVAELMPDYGIHRRWLREEGGLLHQVQFDD